MIQDGEIISHQHLDLVKVQKFSTALVYLFLVTGTQVCLGTRKATLRF